MPLDDAFWPALWSLSLASGTRPETFLAVWAYESGLDPTARNSLGCVGLNQSCPKSIGGPGFPNDDADAYQASPASAQLAWIAPQVMNQIAMNGGPFRSAARYYQANFLPATLTTVRDPSAVLAGKNGPYPQAYAANAQLDATGDGAITLNDLAVVLQRQLVGARGVPLKSAIAAAYAQKPAEAPWTGARLTLFEPGSPASGPSIGAIAAVTFFPTLFAVLLRRKARA